MLRIYRIQADFMIKSQFFQKVNGTIPSQTVQNIVVRNVPGIAERVSYRDLNFDPLEPV